ncbi:hypothetical protein AGRA3207_007462 [Actinomadura graeca]|uniref:Uncharacterized protein n=1 Tax=Actinomadura graeca TaxID=2750812 RepID=A0ABX8R653_9ACTN|nr:hypothetical protein [Actinomadura graeca]QXJ25894.1 hypothetical protein AGRA3207_007462 [Actinomadura graeca]
MTSLQQFTRTAERRRRRVRIAVITLAGLVAAALLAVLMTGKPHSPHRAPATPTSSSMAGQAAQPPVLLPQAGRMLDDKFPVAFPFTPEGAAAAMAAMLACTWTLDAAANQAAADVYAQPRLRAVARRAGRPAAADLRLQIGLPASGAVPEGAYVSLIPIGVRWRQPGPGQVQVAMMATFTSAAGAQAAPLTQTVTLGAAWRWDRGVRGGDWVFTGDDVDDLVPLIAEPGTARFAALGWRGVA